MSVADTAMKIDKVELRVCVGTEEVMVESGSEWIGGRK